MIFFSRPGGRFQLPSICPIQIFSHSKANWQPYDNSQFALLCKRIFVNKLTESLLLQLIIHPDVESMALMMCVQDGMCGCVCACASRTVDTGCNPVVCVKKVGVCWWSRHLPSVLAQGRTQSRSTVFMSITSNYNFNNELYRLHLPPHHFNVPTPLLQFLGCCLS